MIEVKVAGEETIMMTTNSDEFLALPQMTLEHLLEETRQYLSPPEMARIQRAYEDANLAHRGVVRRSGDPYIQHPLEVALLLADMRIDADGIVAALLHDVVEDTDFTLDDLRARFGGAVADIVDGVTKFDTLAGRHGATPFMVSSASGQGKYRTHDTPETP